MSQKRDWRSNPNGFNESVITEFRANGGVVGGELADMRLLLLTAIGARSGRPRTTPLAYHRRGNRYVVIASNGGAARHPSWFHNLDRDPNVTVEVGLQTFPARARILDASEREAVFAAIVSQAPAAGAFQAKAGRTVPVIELEPLNLGPLGRAGVPKVRTGPNCAASLMRVARREGRTLSFTAIILCRVAAISSERC
jgi:deazaflavin-dependent oxidoreductase (nitroreductase family)